MEQKFFGLQIFFWTNIFSEPQLFSDPTFFSDTIIFFGLKCFFLIKNIFSPTLFGLKFFSIQNLFCAKSIFWTNNFFRWKNYFLAKIFLGPQIFLTKIFSDPTLLLEVTKSVYWIQIRSWSLTLKTKFCVLKELKLKQEEHSLDSYYSPKLCDILEISFGPTNFWFPIFVRQTCSPKVTSVIWSYINW